MNKEQENILSGFDRVELIDHTKGGEGRVFVKHAEELQVELLEQDGGKTLKIFLSDSEAVK